MSNTFVIPKRILYGSGALNDMVRFLPKGKKTLLITGNIVKKQSYFAELEKLLDAAGFACTVFSEMNGEPTDKMVEAALQAYTEGGCGFFIAVGGGSAMDLMKAVAVLSVQGGNISDCIGKSISLPLPFMAAIPTTAGTGSEATKFTVITDTKRNVKMLLSGESLVPDLAVLNASFTITSPPHITAYTGLDALTHAIESYTSRKAQPLSDTLALSAIKRICTFLPEAFKDGNNMEARFQMSLAALEAGICINNASVTIVHGMSRPIGALFHVPHGLSNAMLLPKCLAFAMPGAAERFADMGRWIGAASQSDDNRKAGTLFLERVGEICGICKIPTPSEYGIDRERFFDSLGKMADDALASGSPANTRRPVTKNDIVEIYRSLW